jgi:hypothetical protein
MRGRRFVPFGVLTAFVFSACSGGGSSLTPAHRTAAGHTKATFTIKWTNPTATAAMRRKDTISPSAQSIAIIINGALNTVANRTTGATQSIVLDAPVGNDQFTFNVYDEQNAVGNMLGTATVSQQIVDGAANMVNAAIQAVCSYTNVSYANDDPIAITATSTSGILYPTLSSITLLGASTATITAAAEDIDGNVIIAGSGSGNIPHNITGSATVSQIAGTQQLLLTPLSGPRTTTPDTLTLSAPGCTSTTVAVQHSPAIYVSIGPYGFIEDWFGDQIAANRPVNSGDAFIGYDTATRSIIAYNSTSGRVTSYALSLNTNAPLYNITSHSTVAWSNYLHSVFVAYVTGGTTSFYTERNGGLVQIGGTFGGSTTAVATSTFSTSPNAYAYNASNQAITQFTLANSGSAVTTTGTPHIVSALVTDDNIGDVVSFNTATPYISVFSEALSSAISSTALGFTQAAVSAASDTDADNFYSLSSNGNLQISTILSTLLPYQFGFYEAGTVVVVSANEH